MRLFLSCSPAAYAHSRLRCFSSHPTSPVLAAPGGVVPGESGSQCGVLRGTARGELLSWSSLFRSSLKAVYKRPLLCSYITDDDDDDDDYVFKSKFLEKHHHVWPRFPGWASNFCMHSLHSQVLLVCEDSSLAQLSSHTVSVSLQQEAWFMLLWISAQPCSSCSLGQIFHTHRLDHEPDLVCTWNAREVLIFDLLVVINGHNCALKSSSLDFLVVLNRHGVCLCRSACIIRISV